MENDLGARFERLMGVASQLARADTRAQVVRLAIVDGLDAIGARAGVLALAEGKGELRIRASIRDGAMQAPDERALVAGGALFLASREERALCVRAEDGSRVFAVPVRVNGPVAGAFSAELDEGEGDGVLRLLEALSEHLAAALDRDTRMDSLARELALQRDAIDRLPLVVWVTNADQEPVYMNARAAELAAVAHPNRRHAWWDIVHPLDLPAVQAAADQVGIDSWQAEYRLRGRDGAYRWFLGRWCAIRDPSGRLSAHIGCAIDIDSQKNAEGTQRFVAQSSEALALSLDDRTTLNVLANVCVPHIADWCIVDSATREGATSRVAVVCSDGEDRELVATLASSPPPTRDDRYGLARAPRSGPVRRQ